VYASMLGERMRRHGTRVYLVNTGWSGGPFGVGSRMDIDITRALVHAAISGQLNDVEYEEDRLFHIWVPRTCPGIDPGILNPQNTWDDKQAFERRALKLANDFAAHFDKAYGSKGIDPAVADQCPGK
jgi:phosphoenolpyruvate carboxykinase (ATP)